MPGSSVRTAGGEPPLDIFAHIEDSVAPAEHLLPSDLEQRLDRVSRREMTPGNLLERAWLYNEYALATPDFEGDDELFKLGRADLLQILDSELGPRHQIRFGATLLLYYEEIFRRRANEQHVSKRARQSLQRNLGQYMLDFLGEEKLVRKEYGQLSELVAISYLLDTDLLPHIGSRREEANIIREDNHDIYTLHPCMTNRIKKVPASIKFREIIKNDQIVGLPVGRLALATVQRIPQYAQDDRYKDKNRHEDSLRLAADIMVCQTTGDTLDESDTAFAQLMRGKLVAPLVRFSKLPTTPDYTSNAEALRKEIAARRAA